MNRTSIPIVCRKLFDLEGFAPGWKIADLGVGPGHDPIVSMWRLQKILGSGWQWQVGLLDEKGSWFREVSLPDPIGVPGREGKHWDIRPFLNNTWLYLEYESDHSVIRIFDDNWHQIRTFQIGSLPDIAVTSAGHIWARYNDQGIYSGQDIAASGLCCLNISGEPIYLHDKAVEATYAPHDPIYETLLIDDCYAINLVSDNEVWAYFYTDFPLVSIVDHRIDHVWTSVPVKGAHAFAVGDEHALFSGGYDEKHLNLVDLPTMANVQLQPVDQRREPVEYKHWLSVGQANTLYLVNERTIHAVTVTEAIEAANSRSRI